MSYLALARKWRPQTFSQLVGQEHVNKALINSLNRQQLHHAYLFTGTRGVGKTSIARLFAKGLNCEGGIGAEPCLRCETCTAIEDGRFIDLIEIDAASRTGVEDTRELLENVPYRPINGRYKIYLIDEVHMLSQHSFNALLKTLEEPPEHVKFLLATTDPQKLPVTVLSRCLQFSLKHLPADLIGQHLKHILNQEQIDFETEAIDLLAKAARGSMRDALSLLDQAIASVDGKLQAQETKAILGYTQQNYAIKLLQALVKSDAEEIIQTSRQIGIEGGHFRYVIDELLESLHQISLTQTLTNDNSLLYSNPDIKALAQQLAPEDAQLFYQIGLKGTEEMLLAPTLAIGFEMTLLRMLTFRPASKVNIPALAYEEQTRKIEQSTQAESSITPIEKDSFKPSNDDWATILTQLKLTGLALNALEHAEFIEKTEHKIKLRIPKSHESLFTPSVISRIEEAFQSYYNESIKIAFSTDEPVKSSPALQKQIAQDLCQRNAEIGLQNDPFFQQLRQEFSAELVKNSTVPVKNE